MLLFSDPLCLRHDMGPGHPESPGRLQAILPALAQAGFPAPRAAPAATLEQLCRVHDRAYVENLLRLRDTPAPVMLDGDTLVMQATITAALQAAGSAIAAVDAVLAGADMRAFCAVRPPGHHAEPAAAMGFCFFNTVAIAAAHALTRPGIGRVAIVDFDVHHGNGTQAWAGTEPRALFCSTHQMPLYPGSGYPDETGPHANCLNVPLLAGAGGVEFRAALQQHILPRLAAFAPDLILVSAGFDAHAADPLANLWLTETDFAWAGAALSAAANRLCGGKIVSTLEGGYDPAALAASTVAYCQGLQPSGTVTFE